jgi:hypothetical protein
MPVLLAEYCGVAQLVERRIVNPVVGGSSPPATARSAGAFRSGRAVREEVSLAYLADCLPRGPLPLAEVLR